MLLFTCQGISHGPHREYMRYDRRKRAIEYTIYDAQLADASAKLQKVRATASLAVSSVDTEQIEELQKNESAESGRLFAEAAAAHDRLKDAERELRQLSDEIRVLRVDKTQAESVRRNENKRQPRQGLTSTAQERKELMAERAKQELEFQDISLRAEREEERQEGSGDALGSLLRRIQDTERDLERAACVFMLSPAWSPCNRPFLLTRYRETFNEHESRERQLQRSIAELEVTMSSIYSKLGRRYSCVAAYFAQLPCDTISVQDTNPKRNEIRHCDGRWLKLRNSVRGKKRKYGRPTMQLYSLLLTRM